MIKAYLLVALLVYFTIVARVYGRKSLDKPVPDISRLYLKGMGNRFVMLFLLWLIEPMAFAKLNFNVLGKGGEIDQTLFPGLAVIFISPLLYLKFKPSIYAPTNEKVPRIWGYAVKWFPNTRKELSIFALYILTAVIFEELLFRQVAFYAFHTAFNLGGDWLLLPSSILFTLAHTYKKPKELLYILLIGLMLGKAFQYSGTILCPIALHLCMNLTLIILAAKRLKTLRSYPSSQEV